MTYIYVYTIPQVNRMIADLSEHTEIAVDTEATGLDPHSARLLLISISTRSTDYVIDLTRLDTKDIKGLKPILEDPLILKIGHNLTYDWKMFYKNIGAKMANTHDTMAADRLIYAVGYKVPFSLQAVTERRLKIHRDKTIRDSFLTWTQGTVFSHEQLIYSAEDTSYLFAIYDQQMDEIRQKELLKVYPVEMSQIAPAAAAEYTGIRTNKQMLEDMVEPFTNYVNATEKALQDLFIGGGAAETIVFSRDGYTCLNTNSNQQVLAALHKVGVNVPSLDAKEVQRWELVTKRRKNKAIDINYFELIDDEQIADAIDHYPGVENKYLRAISFLKGARKLLDTYVIGLLNKINPITGNVHPNYNTLGAMATGRYSSSGPNFQNLPNNDRFKLLGLGQFSIRNCIEAHANRSLIIADYSGIELVILAVMSGDDKLMYEILQGDIHTAVTREVLGYKEITIENKGKEPHKSWRGAAKTLSYGIAYGTTGRNLSETLNVKLASEGYNITPQQGDELITKWYSLFPKTAEYLNANARQAVLKGYVTDVYGRRRNWDRDTFADKWKRLAAEREGKNAPIQGTSATMTKIAIAEFWRLADFKKARIIITVHDEIVVESVNSYVEEATKILKYAMELAIKLTLPKVADLVGQYEGTSVSPKASARYDK